MDVRAAVAFEAGKPLALETVRLDGPRAGEVIGAFEGEPLYHASLAPEEYRALLAQHGFGVVSYDEEAPACGGHTIWLAQRGA